MGRKNSCSWWFDFDVFRLVLQTGFDQLPDGRRPARQATAPAKLVDALDELAWHRRDDAVDVWVGHSWPIMRGAQSFVNVSYCTVDMRCPFYQR